MAGLAHILTDWGIAVTGTDAAASAMTRSLERRGIVVRIGHCAAAIAGADLVVYSNAVPVDNPERREAVARGTPSCLRGEFLARLGPCFETVIAVGGSHGKTTTTAMVAHILRQAGLAPGYLVGGQVTGWRRSASAGAGRILVTEVDESDGTQALMHSRVAVITNIDDDHCWSVGGVEGLHRIFAEFGGHAATVVAWDRPETRKVLAGLPGLRLAGPADTPGEMVLQVPGEHNRRNACLALLAVAAAGVPVATALTALRTFPGVERRLTSRFRAAGDRRVLVDDYAHHPAELQASLAALREAWPEHRLRVVFQPHRYERVKRYGQEFARVLSRWADEAIVVSPFAAWMDDAAIADPSGIATAVEGPPCCYWDGPLESLARKLVEEPSPEPQVLAMVGAGDLSRVVPQVAGPWREAEWQRLEGLLRRDGVPCDRSRSWAELTSLGVGRDRPLRVLPRDREDLLRAVRCAVREGIPVWPLGAGSKLVGADVEPLRLVVALSAGLFTEVVFGSETVSAGAGVCLAPLIRGMAERGVGDLAMASLAWVPATLGGALRTNAEVQGVAISRFVKDMLGVRADGSEWHASAAEVDWGYRASTIPADVIVTTVRLRCGAAPREDVEAAMAVSGAWRRQAQPEGRSAGRVFRDPPGDHAERLLAEAGCGGLRCGSLVVSNRYANIIVNEGAGASEEDMLDLVEACRERVLARSGVRLEDEVCWCANPTG